VTGTRQISLFAPAKINLFLHVGDKRADGYHNICSVAAFANVGDTVSAALAEKLSIANSGPFARALDGDDDDNLVMRAAVALQDWARANSGKADGARLTLAKNLPIASGIGGGSSDAAATLKLLNQLWHLRASDGDLAKIGATLGADVPVCLAPHATLMQGVGEKLSPWPIPALPAVLVNPRVSVMTVDVFGELSQRSGSTPPEQHPDLRSPREAADWLNARRNDLEAPASAIAPVIVDALKELSATSGCLLSRMSGSGATCFGLYETQAEAAAAARALQEQSPHWWIAATELR
jgi:4-diphosphocytidyl-2-C-methyl-D-erythritol kinase